VKTYYPLLAAWFFMLATVFALLVVFMLVQALIRWVFRISWFKGVNQRAIERSSPVFGGISLIMVALLLFSHVHHKP